MSSSVYVILYQSDPRRMEHMQKLQVQWPELFTIWPAVEGDKLTASDYRQFIQQKLVKPNFWFNDINRVSFRTGQVGCFLSHVLLWEQALRDKQEQITVIEDDTLLVSNFSELYSQVRDELPMDFDFCYIFRHPGRLNEVNNPDLKLADKKHIQKTPPMWGTVGYIISKKGMAKFLKFMKPMFTTIDDMIQKIIQQVPGKYYITTQDLITTVGSLTNEDQQSALSSNVWRSKLVPRLPERIKIEFDDETVK